MAEALTESSGLTPPLQELQVREAQPAPLSWPLAQRILFRLAFIYFVLYCLPHILGAIPGGQFAGTPYTRLWHAICPWIAIHIFHLSGQPTTYFRTGSGDTTLAYIENLVYVVVALAGMLLWSILDRRRLEYRALNAWLRLLVRYTLAFTLFSYGFAKIFPLQFQPPRLSRLLQPFGDFSPMGVLWTFMGSSIPYTIFSGVAEVAGGLLLLFRRTTTLGALVSFAVLTNVVALNFCYDVPVKLYSSNLLLMAAFLAAADAPRLLNVFLLNRPAAPVNLDPPRFQRRWMYLATMAFWILFVGYHLFGQIRGSWEGYQQAYVHPPRPLISGLYEVEVFSPDIPRSWRKIDFQMQDIRVRRSDDTMTGYSVDYYAGPNTIMLNKKDSFVWSRPDPSRLTLKGSLNGTPVSMELRLIPSSKFLLLNRGFHWISEFPFNR